MTEDNEMSAIDHEVVCTKVIPVTGWPKIVFTICRRYMLLKWHLV